MSSFCKCKSYSHFFSKNISVYAIFDDQRFNDTLTNSIVSFEQLGPDRQHTQTQPCWMTLKDIYNHKSQIMKLVNDNLALYLSEFTEFIKTISSPEVANHMMWVIVAFSPLIAQCFLRHSLCLGYNSLILWNIFIQFHTHTTVAWWYVTIRRGRPP